MNLERVDLVRVRVRVWVDLELLGALLEVVGAVVVLAGAVELTDDPLQPAVLLAGAAWCGCGVVGVRACMSNQSLPSFRLVLNHKRSFFASYRTDRMDGLIH